MAWLTRWAFSMLTTALELSMALALASAARCARPSSRATLSGGKSISKIDLWAKLWLSASATSRAQQAHAQKPLPSRIAGALLPGAVPFLRPDPMLNKLSAREMARQPCFIAADGSARARGEDNRCRRQCQWAARGLNFVCFA